jgi:hypothetical protein
MADGDIPPMGQIRLFSSLGYASVTKCKRSHIRVSERSAFGVVKLDVLDALDTASVWTRKIDLSIKTWPPISSIQFGTFDRLLDVI